MNDTGSLRSLDALADGPLPHFIGAGGEETAQFQRGSHRGDAFGQGALGAQFLALLGSVLFRLKSC